MEMFLCHEQLLSYCTEPSPYYDNVFACMAFMSIKNVISAIRKLSSDGHEEMYLPSWEHALNFLLHILMSCVSTLSCAVPELNPDRKQSIALLHLSIISPQIQIVFRRIQVLQSASQVLRNNRFS